MNTAKKGRILEARTRDWIGQAHKSHDVIRMRSAASKGPIDLMLFCLTCGQIRLVQVKCNGSPPPAERRTLAHLADRLPYMLSISIEHIIWHDGKPKSPVPHEYGWRTYAQGSSSRSSHPMDAGRPR